MMSYLEKIKKEGRSANPFFCLMGIDVVSVEPGESGSELQVRPDMRTVWMATGRYSCGCC